MFITISEKIFVPIIIAVILAILATVWKGITNGTLITFLGGVSKTELKNHQHDPLGLEGAVIAFDLNDGCPDGWTKFSQAISRTIVGASFPDSSKSGLTQYKFDAKGGKENIALDTSNIPQHKHKFYDIYYSEKATYRKANADTIRTRSVPGNIGSRGTDYDNKGWMIQNHTELFGNRPATKFTNMPPYIALYYCRRD